MGHREDTPEDCRPTMKQSIEWYLEVTKEFLSKDDRALLERLSADDRTEKVWEIIKAHAERHGGRSLDGDAPLLFIIHILIVKAAAEQESKANAGIAAMAAEIRKLKAVIARKYDRIAESVPFKERSEILKRGRELLERSPSAAISPPRVRSDHNGSRARRYFMRDMSGFVHDVTGQRLDALVGEIADIAFDMPESISADAVRKARSK